MDPDDKLQRLIKECGILNESFDLSDEELLNKNDDLDASQNEAASLDLLADVLANPEAANTCMMPRAYLSDSPSLLQPKSTASQVVLADVHEIPDENNYSLPSTSTHIRTKTYDALQSNDAASGVVFADVHAIPKIMTTIPTSTFTTNSRNHLQINDDITAASCESSAHNNQSILKRKLNHETGLFESDLDSEETNVIPTTGNIVKKTKLNYETGHFETDSDVSCSHIDEGNKKKGKKRIQRPDTWKKNKQVKDKLKDHSVKRIEDCRCDCKSKLSDKSINKIFQKFINLGSHTEQNIYLQGCLKEEIPERFRPRRKNKVRSRRVFKYCLTVKKRTIEVCQQAFLAIHGIKRDRLQFKVQHPEKDITDGRGRHQSKVVYTEDVIRKIHEFIENVPARTSHYCRTSSNNRKYLDSHLSIAALYREFLKQNANLECNVTYEKFREIFNTDFNISFAVPRKDICSRCEKFKMDIQSAEIKKDREEVKKLKLQQEIHLRRAEVFLKKCSQAEKDEDNAKLSICFDYQKNLPLPVTNVSDEYYLRQLWLHNFGIHNLKEKTATMYLYTENYAKKGPNEVLSALDDYISNNAKPNHTHLEIFCDNCFSQNKNKFLFTFLDQLCATGKFQRISVFYPIPGHSMMPIDRDFALIERQKLRHEKIYSPETYIKFVKDSKISQKFEVVFIEKHLGKISDDGDRVIKVKDYKKFYEEKIKASIPGISTCRRIKISRFTNPQMSQTMTGENFQPIRLYRAGIQRNIRGDLDNCYSSMVKVKEAKIKDVKKLMQYIPENDRAFYEEIFQEMALLEAADDQNDSSDDIE